MNVLRAQGVEPLKSCNVKSWAIDHGHAEFTIGVKTRSRSYDVTTVRVWARQHEHLCRVSM